MMRIHGILTVSEDRRMSHWQVGAVVVGFDRSINYYKIQYATLCISENPGCHFIATNLDAKTHLTDAQEWAGNGSMVGAIKGARWSGVVQPCTPLPAVARQHAPRCLWGGGLHLRQMLLTEPERAAWGRPGGLILLHACMQGK